MILGTKHSINDIKQKYQDKTGIEEVSRVRELFLDKSRTKEAVSGVHQIELADIVKSTRGNN